jgi:hypothetical protein
MNPQKTIPEKDTVCPVMDNCSIARIGYGMLNPSYELKVLSCFDTCKAQKTCCAATKKINCGQCSIFKENKINERENYKIIQYDSGKKSFLIDEYVKHPIKRKGQISYKSIMAGFTCVQCYIKKIPGDNTIMTIVLGELLEDRVPGINFKLLTDNMFRARDALLFYRINITPHHLKIIHDMFFKINFGAIPGEKCDCGNGAIKIIKGSCNIFLVCSDYPRCKKIYTTDNNVLDTDDPYTILQKCWEKI